MSDRQAELAARRDTLIAQSTVQREQLRMSGGDIRDRLAGVDRAIEIARTVAKQPAVIAGAIAIIAFIGPRRVLRAVARSAMFVATGRRLLFWLSPRQTAGHQGILGEALAKKGIGRTVNRLRNKPD